MPAVKTVDNGTWDRLIVIPFNGRFRNQATEIKNYGAYLAENCGGAILSWIIEGSQKYIHDDYKLEIPDEIRTAVKSYQEENDWATDFLAEKLIFEKEASATGKELYDSYLQHCKNEGTTPQPLTKFFSRIAACPNVTKKRNSKGVCYHGIGLKPQKGLLFGGIFG